MIYIDDMFTCAGGVFKIFQKRNGILYNCSEKEKNCIEILTIEM